MARFEISRGSTGRTFGSCLCIGHKSQLTRRIRPVSQESSLELCTSLFFVLQQRALHFLLVPVEICVCVAAMRCVPLDPKSQARGHTTPKNDQRNTKRAWPTRQPQFLIAHRLCCLPVTGRLFVAIVGKPTGIKSTDYGVTNTCIAISWASPAPASRLWGSHPACGLASFGISVPQNLCMSDFLPSRQQI